MVTYESNNQNEIKYINSYYFDDFYFKTKKN